MSNPLPEETPPQTMGIVERLVRDDSDRKKFLRMAGGGAAASFGAFVLAACGSSSSSSSTTSTPAAASSASTASSTSSSSAASSTAPPASFGAGDLGIANYALTLEYLETEFYEKVKGSGLFSGAVQALITEFAHEESEHVHALESLIKDVGGTPAAKPMGNFPVTNAADVAMLAYTVENLGAAAYLQQAGNIQSPVVLAAALSIHTVEARHAASLATLVKKPVTNGAFAMPAAPATVLAAVKPFLPA
jgi:hypothetical protein